MHKWIQEGITDAKKKRIKICEVNCWRAKFPFKNIPTKTLKNFFFLKFVHKRPFSRTARNKKPLEGSLIYVQMLNSTFSWSMICQFSINIRFEYDKDIFYKNETVFSIFCFTSDFLQTFTFVMKNVCIYIFFAHDITFLEVDF